MENVENKVITVEVIVHAQIEKVWEYWTNPRHIVKWNFASEDWQTPRAENDVRIGGKFNWRMEAKDGSMGFDFWGVYTDVKMFEKISLTLGDQRKVTIIFERDGSDTKVTESFEAESKNSHELQKNGWQAILNNFKKYVERFNKN